MTEQWLNMPAAEPASFMRPSRTSKILRPGIVLVTVSLLAVVSVSGLIVVTAVLIANGPQNGSVVAVQALILLACLISITYVVLHGIAAKYNDPVSEVRPLDRKLDAVCFILARLALVCWMVDLVATCVMVARPDAGQARNARRTQIAELVASIIGLTASVIVLTTLEYCRHPFELPSVLTRRRFRAGQYVVDFFDRGVSQGSSYNAEPSQESGKPEMIARPSIVRKPLSNTPSEMFHVSGAPPDRPITPLLPMPIRERSGSQWQEEQYARSANQPGGHNKNLSTSDSAIALPRDNSSGALSNRSSQAAQRRATITRRPVGRRARASTVTPSSSISNLARRSPLSSVRSAECPHILVRPELRYCPPNISPPHSWHSSHTSSISQLVPVADVYLVQRRPSNSTKQQDYVIRGPLKRLPPLPQHQTPLVRRKSNDCKVPGSYAQNPSSFSQAENLERHVQKIEVEYVRRSPSKRNQHPSTLRQERRSDLTGLSAPPTRVDTRARYRERVPVERFSSPVTIMHPRPTYPLDNPTEVTRSKLVFGRLSLGLGDLSLGLGNTFD